MREAVRRGRAGQAGVQPGHQLPDLQELTGEEQEVLRS